MSWNPKNNSVDVSKIIENLFVYLEANQLEALEFFQGDASLTGFKKFYRSSSGRVDTVFPSLMLVKKEAATDFSSDVLKVGIRLLFEGHIQGGQPDVIVAQADTYAAALESMLINIDPKVLIDSVPNLIDAINTEVESDFDLLRGNRQNKPTAFLQVFQTQITYTILGESY